MRGFLGWTAIVCSLLIAGWLFLCLFSVLQEFDYDFGKWFEFVYVNKWRNVATTAVAAIAAAAMLGVGLAQITPPADRRPDG